MILSSVQAASWRSNVVFSVVEYKHFPGNFEQRKILRMRPALGIQYVLFSKSTPIDIFSLQFDFPGQLDENIA